MLMTFRTTILAALTLVLPWGSAHAQTARISEETRVIKTYPFSEPNPIPILTRDARLYPYHSFEGYATEGVPREWKVIRLENDWIEVYVLPEAGGKVWGAVVKSTGHEFIYRNEVMKFRNIALRGPWTSGGIEFNFGVIGHTPSTATPVDYALRENPDGSVSCIVGTMDLPSRTHWRVEIRLPADRAYFETNALWYNPTPLEQPYYNWMTAAAFARDDLEMFIPGNAFLEHSGAKRAWPVDPAGRYLPGYANNTFAGHKSYHVVGEHNDFFGGYYGNDDYGFGHWSRHEEMPGQKLWLWALSREGGVWEELLTDTDGQYVEYQAGRLFVQYSPDDDVNPITQAAFDPGAADRWSETWFPLEGIGGLTDASRDGAMHLTHEGGRLTVRANAFGDINDTLRVTAGDRVIASIPIAFGTLLPIEQIIDLGGETTYRVELPALGLDYSSDDAERSLSRPFETPQAASDQISRAQQQVVEGQELAKGRRYEAARSAFETVVAEDPWNREARLGLADLEYRRGLYQSGLAHADFVLQLDAYDARANFMAGNLFRALGMVADARDAFGWAARSMKYRSVANVQLAELMLADGNRPEAARYARLALDYDRYNLAALQILAIIARKQADVGLAASLREEVLGIDPLHHFARAEAFLARRDAASARALTDALRSEYADQTILELAIDHVRRGGTDDARALLDLGMATSANPLLRVWRAWLDNDTSALAGGADPELVFPFRPETLPVLRWAREHDRHWSWAWLLSLNLWALDRGDEAVLGLVALGDRPDFAPFFITRGHLLERLQARDPEADLRQAVQIAAADRTVRIHLVRYLQGQGRWTEALAESATGRARFPGDFNLDLLHVLSLNQLGRAGEAIEILKATQVLPSENARDSHAMWEQAHTLAALDALERDADVDARRYLRSALEWPEHLGQGRPYTPEERLVHYLLGLTAKRLGEDREARAEFDLVVASTDLDDARPGRNDLLAIPSLAALGRAAEIAVQARDADSDIGRVAAEIVRAVAAGGDVAAVISRLPPGQARIFDDLEGRLLLRSLSLSR